MISVLNVHKTKTGCQQIFTVVVLINNVKKEFSVTYEQMSYGPLVNTLICLRYSNDEMQAIINNYLLDSTDENVLNEFNEMQNYRKLCKEVAKQILAAC